MTQTSNADTVAAPAEPANPLTSPLAAHKNCALSPELQLMAATFETARECILRNANATSGPRRWEFLEACDWFWDDRSGWPFTFVNVSDVLGLDATVVRRWLRAFVVTRRLILPVKRQRDSSRVPAGWTSLALWPSGSDQVTERERFHVTLWDEA